MDVDDVPGDSIIINCSSEVATVGSWSGSDGVSSLTSDSERGREVAAKTILCFNIGDDAGNSNASTQPAKSVITNTSVSTLPHIIDSSTSALDTKSSLVIRLVNKSTWNVTKGEGESACSDVEKQSTESLSEVVSVELGGVESTQPGLLTVGGVSVATQELQNLREVAHGGLHQSDLMTVQPHSDESVGVKYEATDSEQIAMVTVDSEDGEESQGNMVGMRQPDDIVVVGVDGNLQCKLCDYRTDKRANWYKHRVVHQDRRYKCPECDYKSKTTSNLQRHMLIHRNVRQYQCHLCEQHFRQKIHLSRHLRYKHLEKSVCCHLCDYVCANTTPDLLLHMKRRHDGATPQPVEPNSRSTSVTMLSCDRCSFATASQKDLRQHMKFHKQGPEIKFFCEKCSFVTDCRSRLARHLLIHSKEKPFRCGQCCYRATQKEHVVRHIRVKHAGDVSHDKNSLEDLMDDSVEKKLLQTQEDDSSDTPCGSDAYSNQGTSARGKEGGATKSNLKKQNNSVDFCPQPKCFACNFCTMKFTKLLNLHKHVHVQHRDLYAVDENQFCCVMCNYTSTSRKNLLVHMRKHAYYGDKSNYSESSQGKGQSRNVTGSAFQPAGSKVIMKEKFTCVLCDFRSELRDILYNHMCDVHNLRIVTQQEDGEDSDLITNLSTETEAAVTALDMVTEDDNSLISTAVSSDKTKVLVQLLPGGPVSTVEISRPSASGATLSLEDVISGTEGSPTFLAAPSITECKGDSTVSNTGATAIPEETEAGNDELTMLGDMMKLPAENLPHLAQGDFIEINGEVYTVELADDSLRILQKS